nr:hypothetical protein [Tanacetum cinerariifolium]
MFDQEGKLAASSNSESQYDCSNGDNACTSNTMKPKIKQFPNSTSLLDRGTVHFGNDHVAAILGFGVDLLKGDRSINLYTINIHEMASASPICLMARGSSTKSWLWHKHLSHLNFDTINDLARNDLVVGLPKFKYHKEHLCPSCEQGKSNRASHPPKPDIDELNPNAMVDGNMFVNPFVNPSTISTMEPKNVKEAMTDPAWIDSMQEELLQFKRLNVWVLIPAPDNISPLTLKWLFKNKHDEEQTIIRNKSRLVMRGYRQEEGIDFEESFAPQKGRAEKDSVNKSGVARSFPGSQTELERTKERFEKCIIKKETEYAKLWSDWYKKCNECKYDKISYDKAYKDMQQKIERLQAQLGDLKGKCKDTSCVSDTQNQLSQKLENANMELEFQVFNYARENAHLKTTYKNLFDSISVSRVQTETKIAFLQNELQSNIYKNDKLRTQLFKKVFDQNDNTQNTSAYTKFAKQPIGENFPKDGVDNTKTKRPKPKSNTKHDRVLSASKSSQSKNKAAKIEEHHRNLLLSKNNKHISSACNNPKIDSQDVISKVVCAMCKKCLISVNH